MVVMNNDDMMVMKVNDNLHRLQERRLFYLGINLVAKIGNIECKGFDRGHLGKRECDATKET